MTNIPHPTTKSEFIKLLDIAICIADNLSAQLDTIDIILSEPTD